MQVQQRDNKGYVTLLATLIVSAFGIALASSLLYLGGIRAQSALILERSFEAHGYADACAEQALLTITQGESYAGSGTIDFNNGNCEFEVSVNESESTVESTGLSDNATRKVKVVATTEPVIGELGTTTDIISAQWLEVADF